MWIIFELPDLAKLASRQQTMLAKKSRQEIVEAYEEATTLAFDAYDAKTDKKFLEMAKKALNISPFCTEAYNILAPYARTTEESIEFYKLAINGSRVFLGEDFFEKMSGMFWGILETRPFMRAMAGLVFCLKKIGEVEKAISGCQEMLKLCPNDNVGIRELLMALLIQTGKYEQAEKLYKEYSEDWGACWQYSRLLLDIIAEKSDQELKNDLKNAIECNGRVAKYLSGRRKLPQDLPQSYLLGSEDEAVYTAHMLREAWNSISGAREWLAENAPKRGPRKKKNNTDN